MLAFLLSKTGLYIIGGILLALALGYVTYSVYNSGYNHGVLVEQVRYDKLVQDINDKNNAEIDRLNHNNELLVTKQNELITDLQTKSDTLDKIVQENENEASQDANRNDPALKSPSVMRLNKIR